MKTYIFVLFGLLTINVYCQDDTIPKQGITSIVLITNSPDTINYMNFGKFLVTKGYSFESKDREFLTQRTYPKGNFYYVYKLLITYAKDEIIIRCQYYPKNAQYDHKKAPYDHKLSFNDWEYSKSNFSFDQEIYQIIMKDIESFDKTKIVYRKD